MKQDKITIDGPKIDGTYTVEFKTADGVALVFSVPKGGGTAVLEHFQDLRAPAQTRDQRRLSRDGERSRREFFPCPRTTKRPDSFEEFQRKQTTKRAALPPSTHNYPDLPSLSHEEITYVDAAREALATMKRTFEFWIVVARGLQALKNKAERIGGRFTFDRLREREGLGGKRRDGTDVLNKTRVSRLLAILEHLADVEKWRAEELTDKQRFDWASPEAVWRHCPVFASPGSENSNKKPSPYEQLKQTNVELQEQLNQALKREDGDTFNAKTSTPREIALALFGQLEPYRGKAEKVARELLALVKEGGTKKKKRGKELTGAESRELDAALASATAKVGKAMGKIGINFGGVKSDSDD